MKLSLEKVIIMTEIKEKVNGHLQGMGIPQVRLVYGKRVYLKTQIDTLKIIKLTGVSVDRTINLFPKCGKRKVTQL